MAPMLKSLGVKVIVSDPFVPQGVFERLGVEMVDLHTLLKEADIVSLHARVTEGTTGMIGEKELRMMKPSACLVNSGRGPLMDYKALHQALTEGWIAGAVLDTFDVEPIDENYPLLGLDNLTFTPHIAGSSKETAAKSCERIAKEVRRFILNKPLECCISWKGKPDANAIEANDLTKEAVKHLVAGYNCAQTTLLCCQNCWITETTKSSKAQRDLGEGLEISATFAAPYRGASWRSARYLVESGFPKKKPSERSARTD